jgi:hypothetical protein
VNHHARTLCCRDDLRCVHGVSLQPFDRAEPSKTFSGLLGTAVKRAHGPAVRDQGACHLAANAACGSDDQGDSFHLRAPAFEPAPGDREMEFA